MNKEELIYQVRFLLGNPPEKEYSDADILKQLNIGYHQAIDYAIQANGKWKVNGNVATTNIEEGQREYALTTNIPLLALNRIEINTTGEVDDWDVVKVEDMRSYNYSIKSNYSFDTADIFGDRVVLHKTPEADVANGLQIWYQQDVLDLTTNNFYVELEEAPVDTGNLELGYKTIVINGLTEDTSVAMVQNTTDDLEITHVGDLLTIKLANTTASKNTDAYIQAAIRVHFSTATVEVYNWTNILGTTIHTGSQIAQEEALDTPKMPEMCQMYLVWTAVKFYAMSKTLGDKLKEANTNLTIETERIKSYYSNRLQTEKSKKLAQKQEQYN